MRTVALGLVVAAGARYAFSWAWGLSLKALGWPDEWIYLTLARNIAERGTLNTNFYIASSVEALGYPHRDVHLPGYTLLLAAFGGRFGYTFDMAAAINAVAFGLIALCTFLFALRLMSWQRSLVAALIVPWCPPLPGYLSVIYPEEVTVLAFVGALTLAAYAEKTVATVLAGFVFGVALLFRETLLFGFPVVIALLGFRRTVTKFLPGFLAAFVAVVMPLSSKRAVHPNALYPSAFTAAMQDENPISYFLGTVTANVRTNWAFLVTSDPRERAEDAVLLLLLGLGCLLGFACATKRLEGRARRVALGVLASLALLFAAMMVLYVVRERGGVWGGVRALMPLMPLFIVCLCAVRANRWVLLAAGALALSLFVSLDAWQIRFFKRYKETNIEDQERGAKFLEDRIGRLAPKRVVGGRYFAFGYRNFPVEIVWSGIQDTRELDELYKKMPFDFVVIFKRSPMRFDLRRDKRYVWLNAEEGQQAEFHIFERIAR